MANELRMGYCRLYSMFMFKRVILIRTLQNINVSVVYNVVGR